MRPLILVLVGSVLLGGCAPVVQLRNAKTGQMAKCGGGIWTWQASSELQHCLSHFHQQGFDPAPESPK
jgi:uncharacterized protein YceK